MDGTDTRLVVNQKPSRALAESPTEALREIDVNVESVLAVVGMAAKALRQTGEPEHSVLANALVSDHEKTSFSRHAPRSSGKES